MNDHLSLVEGYVRVNWAEGTPVEIVARADWDATVDQAHAPFGYIPMDVKARTPALVCPELIAAHVAHLDEAPALDYLAFIEQHAHLHAVHWESDRSPEDMEAFVDRVIYDCAPRAAARGYEIQMRALEASSA